MAHRTRQGLRRLVARICAVGHACKKAHRDMRPLRRISELSAQAGASGRPQNSSVGPLPARLGHRAPHRRRRCYSASALAPSALRDRPTRHHRETRLGIARKLLSQMGLAHAAGPSQRQQSCLASAAATDQFFLRAQGVVEGLRETCPDDMRTHFNFPTQRLRALDARRWAHYAL